MKAVILVLAMFFLFSCQENSTSEKMSSDERERSVELVFNTESGFVPLSERKGFKDLGEEEKLQLTEELKGKINSVLNLVDPSIKLEGLQYRLYSEVSVVLQNLEEEQKEKIFSEASKNNYDALFDIFLQGRRPMMQSAIFPQGRRPMMQEQLHYDGQKKTSRYIESIGGGVIINQDIKTRVWIVDSGIEDAHPDIIIGPEEKVLSKDFTQNGNREDPFLDEYGHGTQIAGIIGGISEGANDGYGMNGVFPKAKMVSVKIFKGKEGKSSFNQLFSALDYIFEKADSTDIVNLSLGYTVDDQLATPNQIKKKTERLEKLITFLLEKKIRVVMSAGNDANLSTTNPPGGLSFQSEFAYTVASYGHYYNPTNSKEERLFSFFSNYGTPTIDYIEPGEYIFTTAPNSSYAVVSGTSFSAAIFSGILYHGSNFDTLGTVLRGDDPAGNNPPYPIAKVR